MSTPNRTDNFSKKQLGIVFKVAFLEAMALSLILPSVVSTGEIPNSIITEQPISFFSNGGTGISFHTGTTTSFIITVNPNSTVTLVVILSAVKTSGSGGPHIKTLCDSFDCSFTNLINVTNVVNFELWWKNLPLSSGVETITATWNMTVIDAGSASTFNNVQTVTNAQSNTGSTIPTTTSLTSTILESGSIIVGGVTTSGSNGQAPNDNDLIQRILSRNKGSNGACSPQCVRNDISDTNSTSFIDHYVQTFSETLTLGSSGGTNWVEGSVELQPLIPEPKIGLSFCHTVTVNCSGLYCTNNGAFTCPQYCGAGIGNCVATIVGTSTCPNTKTNKSTFTSGTFTTITSCTWTQFSSIITNAGDLITCFATYDYLTTVGTTQANFQFKENGGTTFPVKYQLGPTLPTNVNQTLAMSSQESLSAGSASILFQVSVSGVGGTITIGPGQLTCYDVFATGTSPVS